jgi:hypothetical protein
MEVDKSINDMSKILSDNKNETVNIIENITKEDFARIGKYEKNVISMIGQTMGLVKDGKILNYHKFKQILNEIVKSETDNDKNYLIGLLFPYTITYAYYPTPFPMPVFTFKQKNTIMITPNSIGNALIQITSPFLGTSANIVNGVANMTDLWIINSPSLTGNQINVDFNTVNDGTVIKSPINFIQSDLFSAYLLVAMKVTAKYIGRVEDKSGYMGVSFMLSPVSISNFDNNASNFDYIQKGNNFVHTEQIDENLHAIFYPPDNSFTLFRQPGEDYIQNMRSSFAHRINFFVKGCSQITSPLRPSIEITLEKVFACVPQASTLDALRTQMVTVNSEQAIEFIQNNKLAAYKNDEADDVKSIDHQWTHRIHDRFKKSGRRRLHKVRY